MLYLSSMKKALLLFLGIGLIVWSFYLVLQQPAPAKYQTQASVRTIDIGNRALRVEVADTDAKRTLGLSGRESLKEGGMLFVFDTPGNYGFWMKDMRFPIDIIWLDESYHVVDIARNVGPDTFPHIFYPPYPVKYVLETNPGEL